ncbi:hypothetical protein ACFY3O_27415 [Streptomyces sp. NPDC001046]|uniref:hypothetical protein n=1 Tax=Streptomyces sp. NPDC001046 TaxID=3364543 RepID=UPI003673A27C
MTQLERTTGPTPPPSSTLLAWLTVVTGLVSILAVVILSLTHNTEAAATVGAIGTAVTAIGGVQLGMRNRQ